MADALWLLFYPLALAGIVSLAAVRTSDRSTLSWLDGTIGALAIASAGATVAFEKIVEATSGSSLAI
ncbi:MAG TPA: hypothetical protein VNI55_10535, partial [Gaiellaceae bacterium]|nr:hypothetical protein [Gaiellaceae bacterium]